jgi:glutaredoxin
MVFARSYGPHNKQTKEILDNLKKISKAKIEYIDVDLLPGFDSSLIMTELQRISGQWAFPNIFIGTVSFSRGLSAYVEQYDT